MMYYSISKKLTLKCSNLYITAYCSEEIEDAVFICFCSQHLVTGSLCLHVLCTDYFLIC